MIIGGLEKFSLIDYPEHLSAIVFTKGCNFRCQFCYNPMLVWPENSASESIYDHNSPLGGDQKDYLISQDNLFDFLKERVGKLDAVVITGGEPTMHYDLPEFIKKIKKLGFKVKLDTNGTNPKMLLDVLEEKLLDYLAMDIKGSEKNYDLVTGIDPEMNKIKESIDIIMKSGLPYEFRTTLVPELHDKEIINDMGGLIKGAEKWFLQPFKSDTKLVNDTFEGASSFTEKEMDEMCQIAKKYVKQCRVR
ncbi:anaerobic ribonucleoside-triphosphate reductase activating protein [Candidatus Parcubacteria bacterium]|nr:MAG: anaerobic ribonucleoside-triphosphate reductase activating protein [Candidatus Parcubacteria bacterium]